MPMSNVINDILDPHREHLEFLYDQRKLLLDNLSDEEKSQKDISRKLKRLDHKITEFEAYLESAENSFHKSISQ